MPSGQPSLILTHHASAINYAITAQFAGNRQVPLSERVVFMLYLRKSQGFYFRSAPSPHSLFSFFTLTRCVRSPVSPPFFSLSSSSTPLLPLAAVPSHRLPSLTLPPSRYVFTRSLLSPCNLFTCWVFLWVKS